MLFQAEYGWCIAHRTDVSPELVTSASVLNMKVCGGEQLVYISDLLVQVYTVSIDNGMQIHAIHHNSMRCI